VEITYRPAKVNDLQEPERVVQEAGNELRVRHSRQPWPEPLPIAFPQFCLAEGPAYNIASTGLYLKNALYPREPLYRTAAPAEAVAQKLADNWYDTTPMAPRPEADGWISRIDRELPGFDRDLHHRFLLGGIAARAVRIERAGSALGYAYTSAEAHVGPRAIAPDADAKAVVTTARRCALESEPRYVSMIVPGTGGCRHASGIGAGVPPRRALCPHGVAAFWQLEQLSTAHPGFSVTLSKWRKKWKAECPASSISTSNSRS